MNNFNFNPQSGFQDTSSYPNPANENEVREQLNSLHMQTKDFINNEVKPIVDALQNHELDNITSSDGSIVVNKTGKNIDLKVSPSGSQGASQAYVDYQDAQTLESAKAYTDVLGERVANAESAISDARVSISDVKASLGTQVTYRLVGTTLYVDIK